MNHLGKLRLLTIIHQRRIDPELHRICQFSAAGHMKNDGTEDPAGHLTPNMGMRTLGRIMYDFNNPIIQRSVSVLTEKIQHRRDDAHQRTVPAGELRLVTAFQRRSVFRKAKDCLFDRSAGIESMVQRTMLVSSNHVPGNCSCTQLPIISVQLQYR